MNEFAQFTGYNHFYLARILRKKKRYYDHDVLITPKELREESDFICSKRLIPYLEEYATVLERYGEIKLTHEVREKPFTISPATIEYPHTYL